MHQRRSRKYHQKQDHLYPGYLFSSLNGKNKRLVSQAEYDEEKAFFVGQNSIEGINGFPQDIDVGLNFLYNSICQGSDDSLFYLCDLLTNENPFIETDFEKAESLLDEYGDNDDPRNCYLYGLIYREYGKNKKAFKYFKDSLSSNIADAYFNYAEMLFHGIGCYKNKDKAHEYFELAESYGSNKCEKYFLESTCKFKTNINSPYKKSADVVFMIDGTESMSQYIELDDLSEFCNDLIQKLWDECPKVFFRFGVVLYRDTAVTNNINNCETEEVDFLPLTKIKGKIKSFISDSSYWKGGYDGPEDWASGYDFLLNKIEWDKNSEKIVIHIADAPGHGNFFTGTSPYKIPSFDRKFSKFENQNFYNIIQAMEEVRLKTLIKNAASKGIMFYCLNLNKYATNCFNVTKELYMQNKGTEFVIQNHFDVLDYDTFEDFVCNSVSSCFNKARKMRQILKSKELNKKQETKYVEDAKNKITIKRPPIDQIKKNKLLFIRKQVNDNNKEDADDKMPADQVSINNSSDANNNKNNSIDKSDGDEKEKVENKSINDSEESFNNADDEEDEEYDLNDEKDGDEEYDLNDEKDGDEEYDLNDEKDGDEGYDLNDEKDEDEEYDLNDEKDGDEEYDDDKTKNKEEYDDDDDDEDVDTNETSDHDFD